MVFCATVPHTGGVSWACRITIIEALGNIGTNVTTFRNSTQRNYVLCVSHD